MNHNRLYILLISILIFIALFCDWSAAFAADTEFPTFEKVVLDANIGKVCYAVTLADVDGDDKRDIVAVTENQVLWYQAPDWKKRVIIKDQTERDNVCIAPYDIDGDGKIDFALGAGWTQVGTIQWLARGESLDDKWNVHMIGQERWLHRMRFADVLDTGQAQLVISPLNKTVGNGVRLTAFSIPENPKSDRWPQTVLDDTLNRMHNHWHLQDHNPAQTVLTLTASQEGLHAILKNKAGWTKKKISDGHAAEKPDQSGAGEVKFGEVNGAHRFITSIEPMHGHTLAVYTKEQGAPDFQRHVLTTELVRGHALWTTDIDGDGDDEIVVGHSNTREGENLPRGIDVYDCTDDKAKAWTRHVIDEGGIAVEDAIAADVTGDGKADIIAGGRYTHNLVLYVNQGK